MRKIGRNKPKIDWDKVDNLLIAGCTGTEVAAHIGIHYDTLYRRCELDKKVGFAIYLQEKRAKGDTLLRAAQFDEAVRKRDKTMLVWLGKNRLLQKDKSEVTSHGTTTIEVVNFGTKAIKPWENKETKKIEEADNDTRNALE